VIKIVDGFPKKIKNDGWLNQVVNEFHRLMNRLEKHEFDF